MSENKIKKFEDMLTTAKFEDMLTTAKYEKEIYQCYKRALFNLKKILEYIEQCYYNLTNYIEHRQYNLINYKIREKLAIEITEYFKKNMDPLITMINDLLLEDEDIMGCHFEYNFNYLQLLKGIRSNFDLIHKKNLSIESYYKVVNDLNSYINSIPNYLFRLSEQQIKHKNKCYDENLIREIIRYKLKEKSIDIFDELGLNDILVNYIM